MAVDKVVISQVFGGNVALSSYVAGVANDAKYLQIRLDDLDGILPVDASEWTSATAFRGKFAEPLLRSLMFTIAKALRDHEDGTDSDDEAWETARSARTAGGLDLDGADVKIDTFKIKVKSLVTDFE